MIKKLMLVIPIIFSMLVTNLYGLEISDGLCLRPPVLSNVENLKDRVEEVAESLPNSRSLAFSSPYAVFEVLARSKQPVNTNGIASKLGISIRIAERILSQLVKRKLVISNGSSGEEDAAYKLIPEAEKWKARILQNLADLPARPSVSEWKVFEARLEQFFGSHREPILELSMAELHQLEEAKDIPALVDSITDLFHISGDCFQIGSLIELEAYEELEKIILTSEDVNVIFDSLYSLQEIGDNNILKRLLKNQRFKKRMEIIIMASDDIEMISNSIAILAILEGWDNLRRIILNSSNLPAICDGIGKLSNKKDLSILRNSASLKAKLIRLILESKDSFSIKKGISALNAIENPGSFKDSILALASEDNFLVFMECISVLEAANAEADLDGIAETMIADFLSGKRYRFLTEYLGLAQYGKGSSSPSFQNLLERWFKKKSAI